MYLRISYYDLKEGCYFENKKQKNKNLRYEIDNDTNLKRRLDQNNSI